MNWKVDPIQAGTVQEAIDILFRPDPFYDDNRQQEQLYGHDFLHALLCAKPNSDTAEEIVAIYQAVLLGRADVATVVPPAKWQHYGAPPMLEEIHAVTIPCTRKFVDDTVERLRREHELDKATNKKFEIRNYLTPHQIAEHYQKALLLRRLFKEKFNRHLGEIPIEELGTLAFPPFQELIGRMENLYSRTAGGSGNSTSHLPSFSRN